MKEMSKTEASEKLLTELTKGEESVQRDGWISEDDVRHDMKSTIVRNIIRCKHCGDILESYSVHDFKLCSCGACAVDGGHEYLRRCFKTSPEEDYDDLSECQIDNTMTDET